MSGGEKSWYGKKYDEYYDSYVPWLEDKYLAWFGENKTSYTAKGTSIIPSPLCPNATQKPAFRTISPFLVFLPLTGMPVEQLRKTEITGNKQVDAVQEGVVEGVGGQFGKGGLLNPVGEGVSDQGVTRAEKGDMGPLNPEEAKKQQGYLGGAADKVKGAGSSLGGWLPGGGKK